MRCDPARRTGNRQRRAFTMIEVLLVAALLAMVALGLFHALAGGLGLWQRSLQAVHEEDVAIFLDQFSQDLRQSFYYTAIGFSATDRACQFATFVTTAADRNSSRFAEDQVLEPGAVRYEFDAAAGTIVRRQANYAQALKGAFGNPQTLARSIQDLKFTYFYPGQTQYVGEDKASDVIPSAVRVAVRIRDGESERTLQQLINIPAGL